MCIRDRFKTITWDNGTEFHGYRQIEAATGIRCFFAYPHHPWERGSNENFNGLLRQYFRKGKSLSGKRQADCDRAAFKLNTRPRKRYGFQTPANRMQKLSGAFSYTHLMCIRDRLFPQPNAEVRRACADP